MQARAERLGPATAPLEGSPSLVAKHSPYSYSITPVLSIKVPQDLGVRRTTPVAGVCRTTPGVRQTTPRGTNPGVRRTTSSRSPDNPPMDRAVSKCSTWTGGLQMNRGPSKRTAAGQGAPQPLQGTGRSFSERSPNGGPPNPPRGQGGLQTDKS